MHAETLFAETDVEADIRLVEIWNELAAFSSSPDRYRLQAGKWDSCKKSWLVYLIG
jgi:hypothetical protein